MKIVFDQHLYTFAFLKIYPLWFYYTKVSVYMDIWAFIGTQVTEGQCKQILIDTCYQCMPIELLIGRLDIAQFWLTQFKLQGMNKIWHCSTNARHNGSHLVVQSLNKNPDKRTIQWNNKIAHDLNLPIIANIWQQYRLGFKIITYSRSLNEVNIQV